jgi:hypothetical protein
LVNFEKSEGINDGKIGFLNSLHKRNALTEYSYSSELRYWLVYDQVKAAARSLVNDQFMAHRYLPSVSGSFSCMIAAAIDYFIRKTFKASLANLCVRALFFNCRPFLAICSLMISEALDYFMWKVFSALKQSCSMVCLLLLARAKWTTIHHRF